jgi:hypothetical protein
MYDVRCPPCDEIVEVWRTLSTPWWDCRCMTYVVHPVMRLLSQGGQRTSYIYNLITGWTTYVIHLQSHHRVDNVRHTSTISSQGGQRTSYIYNLITGWTTYVIHLQSYHRVDNVRHTSTILSQGGQRTSYIYNLYDVRCAPCDKIVDVWRTLSILW